MSNTDQLAKSTALSFAMAFVGGVAEGAAKAKVPKKNKNSKAKAKGKAKSKSNGKSKPKPKSKKSVISKLPTDTKSQKQFKEWCQKYGGRGLRPEDPSRTLPELKEFYRTVPKPIRKGGDDLMKNFMDKRHAGHQVAHSKGGGNLADNMIWQDPRSNSRLSARPMPPELKDLLRQNNHYFGKHGEDCDDIMTKIDRFLDSMPKEQRNSLQELEHEFDFEQKSQKKKSKRKNGSHCNGKKSDFKDILLTNGVEKTLTTGASIAGNAAGKAVGKKLASKVAQKSAKKLGKKAAKAVPVVGTLMTAGCCIHTIASDPGNPWAWVSGVSGVATSFLPFGLGVAADLVIESGIQYIQQ